MAKLGERRERLGEITWAGMVEILIYFSCGSQSCLTCDIHWFYQGVKKMHFFNLFKGRACGTDASDY